MTRTNMRLKADILLEELARRWSICGNGALACRPKMLFDRVPHQVGLEGASPTVSIRNQVELRRASHTYRIYSPPSRVRSDSDPLSAGA